jgi:hypothetical protein
VASFCRARPISSGVGSLPVKCFVKAIKDSRVAIHSHLFGKEPFALQDKCAVSLAALLRARAQGKRLGRQPYAIADDRFEAVSHLSLREAAQLLGVSRSVVHRFRLSRKPLESGADSVTKSGHNSRG